MTDNSVLEKYTGKRFAEAPDAEAAELEQEISGVFGYLRGTRDRALMLELRKKSGEIKAIGYAWLEAAEFNPSEGIILTMAGKKIHIKGRNLNSPIKPNVRLFQGITRHRVPWIKEADNATRMETGNSGVCVEWIEW